ncbi:hypothetical protein MSG28_001368 [Choristoneura fumiferana]|uniref:Uncharacterized protein n=1 Tax=Choristoneura fumiferana TaxID=7141 RepID=A0ACC0KUR2_CHOFU|nr:hypothetical protein MSG28_001368 [Choristoneura fumiferana]
MPKRPKTTEHHTYRPEVQEQLLMKPQAFGVALVTLAILTACSAHIGGGQLMQELNPKIFCGRNLAIALAELCSFQNAEKRGDAGTMYRVLQMRCQPRGLRWDTTSASNFTGCLTLHAETQQCKHCYFTAGLASKMVVAIRADLAQDIIVPPYYKDPEHYSWPWLAPHHAHGLSLPNRGKRLTGIVNECCDKPCNIDEMLSYC